MFSRSKRLGQPVRAFVPEVGAVPFPGYRLIRLRGQGGFATVWESESPAGVPVALKFMSTQHTSSTARELRSLQAIQTLDHRNLARTLNVWSLPGTIVIGMDLAEASLLDLLEVYLAELGRPLEPEKAGLYLFQVAQALDFLNARRHRIDGRTVGLQHGDVKPNNVLLFGEDAKLTDYGLATPTSGPNTPCPRHGTVEYCAPEVFQGNLTDWSDQFGLAVTYHVLRTGLFPFPPPPAARGDQLKGYQRPDPDLSHLTPGERPAVLRALNPIPQQRFPTCTHFLSAVLSGVGLNAAVADSGEVTVRPARRGSSSSSEFFV